MSSGDQGSNPSSAAGSGRITEEQQTTFIQTIITEYLSKDPGAAKLAALALDETAVNELKTKMQANLLADENILYEFLAKDGSAPHTTIKEGDKDRFKQAVTKDDAKLLSSALDACKPGTPSMSVGKPPETPKSKDEKEAEAEAKKDGKGEKFSSVQEIMKDFADSVHDSQADSIKKGMQVLMMMLIAALLLLFMMLFGMGKATKWLGEKLINACKNRLDPKDEALLRASLGQSPEVLQKLLDDAILDTLSKEQRAQYDKLSEPGKFEFLQAFKEQAGLSGVDTPGIEAVVRQLEAALKAHDEHPDDEIPAALQEKRDIAGGIFADQAFKDRDAIGIAVCRKPKPGVTVEDDVTAAYKTLTDVQKRDIKDDIAKHIAADKGTAFDNPMYASVDEATKQSKGSLSPALTIEGIKYKILMMARQNRLDNGGPDEPPPRPPKPTARKESDDAPTLVPRVPRRTSETTGQPPAKPPLPTAEDDNPPPVPERLSEDNQLRRNDGEPLRQGTQPAQLPKGAEGGGDPPSRLLVNETYDDSARLQQASEAQANPPTQKKASSVAADQPVVESVVQAPPGVSVEAREKKPWKATLPRIDEGKEPPPIPKRPDPARLAELAAARAFDEEAARLRDIDQDVINGNYRPEVAEAHQSQMDKLPKEPVAGQQNMHEVVATPAAVTNHKDTKSGKQFAFDSLQDMLSKFEAYKSRGDLSTTEKWQFIQEFKGWIDAEAAKTDQPKDTEQVKIRVELTRDNQGLLQNIGITPKMREASVTSFSTDSSTAELSSVQAHQGTKEAEAKALQLQAKDRVQQYKSNVDKLFAESMAAIEKVKPRIEKMKAQVQAVQEEKSATRLGSK